MKNNIIETIDIAIKEIQTYIIKHERPKNSFDLTIKVLLGLKEELIKYDEIRNERLLRGFKDICTNVSRNFEGENFDEPIFTIAEYFSNNIANYTDLDLLRMDFGNGDPI